MNLSVTPETGTRTKYPRTPHLPASPGRAFDDVTLADVSHLRALSEIVVTEKMDGENTTLYRDYLHARSVTYQSHASRNCLKRWHATFCADIPIGFRICGENLHAKHSILYEALPAHFLVFAIFDGDICLLWAETEAWSELLGLAMVPILYRGAWDDRAVVACFTGNSRFGGAQEGYVVRNSAAFSQPTFGENVAKFVRARHVTTAENWKRQVAVVNGLEASR